MKNSQHSCHLPRKQKINVIVSNATGFVWNSGQQCNYRSKNLFTSKCKDIMSCRMRAFSLGSLSPLGWCVTTHRRKQSKATYRNIESLENKWINHSLKINSKQAKPLSVLLHENNVSQGLPHVRMWNFIQSFWVSTCNIFALSPSCTVLH